MPDSFTDEPIIIHRFWWPWTWLDDCIWPLDRHSLTGHMFIWQPFPSTRLRVQFCLFSFKSVYFSWIKLSSWVKLWVVGGTSFPINLLLCLILLLLARQQSDSSFGKKMCACVCVCIMCVRALSYKSHLVSICQNLLLSMARKVKKNPNVLIII